jgi:hypothetical protein
MAPPATPAAVYHLDCARIALNGGNRLAAMKHAAASIACAPLQIRPYVTIAACVLPTRALVRLYASVRTLRSRAA